jgi:hypothetical protein
VAKRFSLIIAPTTDSDLIGPTPECRLPQAAGRKERKRPGTVLAPGRELRELRREPETDYFVGGGGVGVGDGLVPDFVLLSVGYGEGGGVLGGAV